MVLVLPYVAPKVGKPFDRKSNFHRLQHELIAYPHQSFAEKATTHVHDPERCCNLEPCIPQSAAHDPVPSM